MTMKITLQDVQRGYDDWAAQPHNKKWVRKIDGTPIANDIVVRIFTALSSSPSDAERHERAIPDGWQLVPIEPNPNMLGAWYRYKNGVSFADEPPATDTSDYGAYRAMLAAAPPSPASAQGPVAVKDERNAVVKYLRESAHNGLADNIEECFHLGNWSGEYLDSLKRAEAERDHYFEQFKIHCAHLTPVSENEKRGMERVLAILDGKFAEGGASTGGTPEGRAYNAHFNARKQAFRECATMLRSALSTSQSDPVPETSSGLLREALARMENCFEYLAATRTNEIYTAMIDGGQTQALLDLDAARRNAREVLSTTATDGE